jgi:hypothetical protein
MLLGTWSFYLSLDLKRSGLGNASKGLISLRFASISPLVLDFNIYLGIVFVASVSATKASRAFLYTVYTRQRQLFHCIYIWAFRAFNGVMIEAHR